MKRSMTALLVAIVLVAAAPREARAQFVPTNAGILAAGGIAGGLDLGFIVYDLVMVGRHRRPALFMSNAELIVSTTQLAMAIGFVATSLTGQHNLDGTPTPELLLPIGGLMIAASLPLLLHAMWAIRQPDPNAPNFPRPASSPGTQSLTLTSTHLFPKLLPTLFPTLLIDARHQTAVFAVAGVF